MLREWLRHRPPRVFDFGPDRLRGVPVRPCERGAPFLARKYLVRHLGPGLIELTQQRAIVRGRGSRIVEIGVTGVAAAMAGPLGWHSERRTRLLDQINQRSVIVSHAGGRG